MPSIEEIIETYNTWPLSEFFEQMANITSVLFKTEATSKTCEKEEKEPVAGKDILDQPSIIGPVEKGNIQELKKCQKDEGEDEEKTGKEKVECLADLGRCLSAINLS